MLTNQFGQSALANQRPPAQAQAVHAFIRGHIAAKSQAVADQVIIQYGGSVNDANAAELFTQPDIDGALDGAVLHLKRLAVCS